MGIRRTGRVAAAGFVAAALGFGGCTAPIGCPARTGAGTASQSSASPSAPATTSSTTTSAPATTTSPGVRTTGTSRPGTAAGPAGTGPSAGATPLVTVTVLPTFYCSVEGTSTASLVVYDDGWVFATSGIGAWCDEVPVVESGWLDPNEVVARIDRLLASPESTVDLSRLDVTDLPMTTVRLVGSDRSASIRVYGLGFDEFVPAEQAAARAALTALTDGLRSAADKPWRPDRLSVVVAERPERSGTLPARWPAAATEAIAELIGGARPPGTCVEVVDPAAVTAILRAQGSREAAGAWTVEGREMGLAVGVVLPSQSACQRSRPR